MRRTISISRRRNPRKHRIWIRKSVFKYAKRRQRSQARRYGRRW